MTDTNPGDYVKLGWKVFPCYNIEHGFCTCMKGESCENPGKHPRTRNGVKDATRDLDQLRTWWQMWPNANWALACGSESDVVVIDLDPRKGGYDAWDEFESDQTEAEYSDTLIALTGGGGRHIYMRYPTNGTVGNRVGWLPGVDVRSDGGYVILPPATHISGGKYAWSNWGHRIMEAPDGFVKSAGVSGRGGVAANKLGPTDLLMEGLEEGSRDDTIFRLACRWRRQLGDERNAVTTLVLAVAANSIPPFPVDEALAKVDQAFKQVHDEIDGIFTGSTGPDAVEEGFSDEPMSRLTDMGNRDRFIRAYGDDLRYVVGLGWHRWSDLGWVQVDELTPATKAEIVPSMIRDDAARIEDLAMRQRFMNWANQTESAGKLASIVTLAKGHPDVKKEAKDFDSETHLLACRNGMVDLRDGSLRGFTRDDLFTRNTKVIYDPDFTLPQWEHFLESTTNGDKELQEYLQMAAGYSLTGSVAEECFFIISGPTNSGKSTYMDGLIAAMGGYTDASPAETFMKRFGKDAPREELVKFAGARVISTAELPEGERFDDAFMKKITGGDPISARFLYQEGFTFYPQFKLWMATNHDPITSDSAMFRRIKRVPFLHTVPEAKRDRTLKEIIKNPEIGGKAVLAWAVRGAIKYYEQGKLTTPLTVVLATGEYQADQDSFTHFLGESFTADPNQTLRFTQAYAIYVAWCKEAQEKAVRRPQFLQKLKERSITVSQEDNGDKFITGMRPRMDASSYMQAPFQSEGH